MKGVQESWLRQSRAEYRAAGRIAVGARGEHLVQRDPAVLEAHRAAAEVEPVGTHHALAGNAPGRLEL